MTVWLLAPADGGNTYPGLPPWNPADDQPLAVVVVAPDETSARQIADTTAIFAPHYPRSVIRSTDTTRKITRSIIYHAWLDPEMSTCVPIDPNGPTSLVLIDRLER
jgi:hypothetical protein